jgi:hypothetical protein
LILKSAGLLSRDHRPPSSPSFYLSIQSVSLVLFNLSNLLIPRRAFLYFTSIH